MKNLYLRKFLFLVLGVIVIFAIKGLYILDNNKETLVDFSKNLGKKYLHFDGPAKYAKIHHYIRTRDGMSNPEYEMGYAQYALQNVRKSLKFRNSDKLNWVERGPTNAGGRTRSLIVDPDDSTHQTFYAGSVGGGIWKTEDAGNSWLNLTPDFPNLATSTLAMSNNNTNIIYAGTGEGFDGLMVNGNGIWKSEDKGISWHVLESTSHDTKFQNILRIIVNPENENELLVCTIASPRDKANNALKSYILKSLDGGMNWDIKFQTNYSPIQQLVYTPGNFNLMYASSNNNGILKSTDAGENWEKVFDSQSHGVARIEMAVSPIDAGRIFLSCEYDDNSKLFITKDTFNTVQEVFFNGNTEANWLSGQGWYDNTIAAHPYDKNIIWAAGSGAMLEIEVGSETSEIKTLQEFQNNTTFLVDVNSNTIPVSSHGLASDFLGQLLLNPQTSDDDFVDVEVRFGPDKSQKAHLLKLNFFNFNVTYDSYIDVPFEVWDTANNRQLSLSFIDSNEDGKWTYDDYTNNANAIPDVVVINMIDYSEEPNNNIVNTNVAYKGQYYFYMGKNPAFDGTEDDFPIGTFYFKTGITSGLVADFTPVTDGYYQFYNVSPVGSKGVHVDHHNIIFIPINDLTKSFYVLNANDGGVAFSKDNGQTFKQTGDTFQEDDLFETSDGYNVSQFYGVDKMNGGDRFIGGTQDNGTWISPLDVDANTKWNTAPSGDGFEAAWNYANPDLILESSQYNNIYKSTDGGNNWSQVNLPQSEGPFLTRIISSQLDPDLVFVCSADGLIKSTDFGDTWTIKTMPSSWSFSFFGPPTAISLADANIVWSGANMTQSSRIALSEDKGETWTEVNYYSLAELGRITGITTHPTNPNTAYALFSQANGPKIMRTTDLGKSWRDISGFKTNKDESDNGFPDVATYSLLVMPFDTNRIWAGTEIGIFESLNGGESWNYADNGFPAVGIWQMKIVNDQIVIATHGRGIWTLSIEELVGTNNPESITIDFKIYPNPMLQSSVISFSIPDLQHTEVSIYTMEGKMIKNIISKEMVGEQNIKINRNNLLPGNYLISIKTKDGINTKKLIVQ